MRRGFQGQERFLKSPSAAPTPPFSGLLGEGPGVYSSGSHSYHRVTLGKLFYLLSLSIIICKQEVMALFWRDCRAGSMKSVLERRQHVAGTPKGNLGENRGSRLPWAPAKWVYGLRACFNVRNID